MFYAGTGMGGPVFLPWESHLLVLGPPRSGKTRSIVVPNVEFAPGPVIATSTKGDLMELTESARRGRGELMVFDPSDSILPVKGAERVHWSPVDPSGTYSRALSVTRAMVDAHFGGSGHSDGYSHWVERASSLIAPLIHAAQIGGYEMDTLMEWLNRRECKDPAGILKACGEHLALDALRGILLCEERERSGIFSTALGILASYNIPEVHDQHRYRRLDIDKFLNSGDTLYVISPAHIQRLAAPVMAAMIDEVKNASYRMALSGAGDRARLPLSLILDEMANVAPLGSLPSILSEGASQKVLVLGALQDLSQARVRWGEASSGFLTLFGSVLVLPGISDSVSLEQLSRISGLRAHESLSVTSKTSLFEKVLSGPTATRSVSYRPLLEPWDIARAKGGSGFLYRRSREVRKVSLPHTICLDSLDLSCKEVLKSSPTWSRRFRPADSDF